MLGLARSGEAAARALLSRGDEVVGHDASTELDVEPLTSLGADVRLGPGDAALLDGVDLVVKSPGIGGRAPLVEAARARGLPVISEIELGAQAAPEPHPRRHGHERQDDDDGIARRRSSRQRAAPSRWPATSAAR